MRANITVLLSIEIKVRSESAGGGTIPGSWDSSSCFTVEDRR